MAADGRRVRRRRPEGGGGTWRRVTNDGGNGLHARGDVETKDAAGNFTTVCVLGVGDWREQVVPDNTEPPDNSLQGEGEGCVLSRECSRRLPASS